MNYKKIIKSRNARIAMLKCLDFIPDPWMIRLQYWIKTGRKLNLKQPVRFSEKLQWYKLNSNDPRMSQCVDKYEVRKYVESKGLSHILVPLLGIYESADDVDFSKLPDRFVIKDTLGGGGNSVILVTDKSKLDIESTKEILRKWVSRKNNHKPSGREWVYQGHKPRIIAEELIAPATPESGVADYKFFCFDGKVGFIYYITDRILGVKARFGIFDSDFNKLDIYRNDESPLEALPKKPENFNELVRVAEILSEDFRHVRVDLYNENNQIRFGELTFFDGSGNYSGRC